MSKGKKHIGFLLVALFLGYTIVYVDKLSVGFALIPISKEFGFSSAAKGQIMSAFFIGYAIMQVPMGVVINKVGARAVLIFSVLCIGLFSFVFGFGTSLIMFIIIRFLTGLIAHSGYASSASTELALNVPAEKRTFAQGILLSSSGFASIVGPLLLPFLITKWGWQNAYYLLTVLSVIVAIILIIAVPKTIAPKDEKTVTNKKKISILTVWSDGRVWILFLSAFFINCLLYGFAGWIPSFLTEERGLSLSESGIVNAVAGIFALIGSVGGSYLVGKFFANKEKLVVAGTAILGSVAMFGAYFVKGTVIVSLVLGIANFFLILCFVSMMSIPLKIFEGERFAPSYATLATGGILGGVVSPTLIGMLVEASGSFVSTFVFFLVVGVMTALIILFIKQKKDKIGA